ncbi:MAG: SurA N-terminal domain-containing protein [Patescibacteria group bacterium]|nr:SurA N-terminal domain-containing protein [Patescibacteria group bacterium]MBU2509108.1 SurA N-terminal domain-containing protein [Patescibacteria group bacterium]
MQEQEIEIKTITRENPKKWFYILGVLLVVLILVGVAASFSWAVFVKRSDSQVVRSISNILPVPAAKLGDESILYSEFLKTRDTLAIFLESEAANEQQLAEEMNVDLEKNVLEKLLNEAALDELAEEKGIEVSEEDLRSFFADVVTAASTTTPDVGLYLLESFGWSEEDFRQNVLRPAILEQQLSIALAGESQGDPNALGAYLIERLERNDVVRYLRF